MSFENLFFKIPPRHILYMRYPFGHLYGRTCSAQVSSKNRIALTLKFFKRYPAVCHGFHLEILKWTKSVFFLFFIWFDDSMLHFILFRVFEIMLYTTLVNAVYVTHFRITHIMYTIFVLQVINGKTQI